MKASTNASGTNGAAPQQFDMAVRVGSLSAPMWKEDGKWRFTVVHMDAETDMASNELSPVDVIHLAMLTSKIAQALYEHAGLDTGLGDDLGCLAHNLAQTLGMSRVQTEFVMHPPVQ